MWNQAQTRHANSSTNLLCVFFASAAQIFSLLLRVKALNLYSFKVIIIIIILCLTIIIIVMIIIGAVGFRSNYRGAWPLCLLCPAYTLISTGNMVMILMMIMMMMLWMKMMMMIKFDVFQESSSSPSSLSFRSRTLYKFQPHLSAGDWYKIQIQIQVTQYSKTNTSSSLTSLRVNWFF